MAEFTIAILATGPSETFKIKYCFSQLRKILSGINNLQSGLLLMLTHNTRPLIVGLLPGAGYPLFLKSGRAKRARMICYSQLGPWIELLNRHDFPWRQTPFSPAISPGGDPSFLSYRPPTGVNLAPTGGLRTLNRD